MKQLSLDPTPPRLQVFVACLLSFAILFTPIAAVAAPSIARVAPAKTTKKTDKTDKAKSSAKDVFVNPPTAPAPQPLPPAFGTLTAAMTATFPVGGDVDGDTKADPGDTIKYTVTLDNTAGTLAGTGLTYTDTVDTHTTLSGTWNSTPVAFDQSVQTNEDTAVPITLTGEDPDGTALSLFTIVTPPAHGTLTPPGGTTAGRSYLPAADYNGPDSFTFKVNDGTADSNQVGTVNITVVGVNDAPCFSATPSPCVPALPGAQTFNEDTPRVFNTAGSNRIRVSDVDSGASNVTFTASVLHGTINVSTAGVSVTNNNTASISVVGTVANIDTAINGLTFTPTLNYNGSDTLTLNINDNGNTGLGGALSAGGTINFTINPVNDVPTVPDRTEGNVQANMKISIGAGTSGAQSGLLVGAADVDSGDAGFVSVIKVGSIGAAVPSGSTITANIAGVGNVVADINTGSFTFDPEAGLTPGSNVSFNYTVCDNGRPGTACSVTHTVTFAVVGPTVWFVDPGNAVNGDGRLSSPFNNFGTAATKLASLNTNQRIFVYSGNTTTNAPGAGVTLLGGASQAVSEWLIGQNATDTGGTTNFDTFMGFTPPSGTIPRPTIGPGFTKPTINGRVQMNGSNTRVQGVAIAPPANTQGLTASSGAAMTGMQVGISSTVSDVTVATSGASGTAVSLSNAGGVFTFISVAANGAANGISVTSTTGTFTVLGSGTTAGSGGLIQNCTQHGAAFNMGGGSSKVILKNMTFTANGTNLSDPTTPSHCGDIFGTAFNTEAMCGAGISLTNIGSTGSAGSGTTLNNVSVTNGQQVGINIQGGANVTITGSTVSGNGNQVSENGLQALNLAGTMTITDSSFTNNAANQIDATLNSTATANLIFDINKSGGANPVIRGFTAWPTNGTSNAGIRLGSYASGRTLDFSATDVNFTNSFSAALLVRTDTGGHMIFDVLRGVFSDNGMNIDMQGQGSGNMTYTVDDITTNVDPNHTSVGSFTFAKGATASGNWTGTIKNCDIGTAGTVKSGSPFTGLRVISGTSGQYTATITNNIINEVGQHGIDMSSGKNISNDSGSFNWVVQGNTINATGAGATGQGIFATAGSASGDSSCVHATIGGAGALKNTIGGTWSGSVIRVRNRFTTTNFFVVGYGGATVGDNSAAIAAYVSGQNNGVSTTATALDPSSTPTPFNDLASCPLMLGAGGILALKAPALMESFFRFGLYASDYEAIDLNSSIPTASTVSASLDQQHLDSIVSSAIARWAATGLTPQQVSNLQAINFDVVDLSGSYLGEADGNHVLVDRTAQDKGWFVDSTPLTDSEFGGASGTRRYTDPSSAPAGHIDLLTAIMHEMGHKLGLDDSYTEKDRDSLMYGYLTVGERRLPSKGQAANASPNQNVAAHFLSLLESAETPVNPAVAHVTAARAGETLKATTVASPLSSAVAAIDAHRKTTPKFASASASLSGEETIGNASPNQVTSQRPVVSPPAGIRLNQGSIWPGITTRSSAAIRSMFVAPPFAGETVTVNGTGAGFSLPIGKSTTITYNVTVNNPPALSGVPPATPQISNFGTLSGGFDGNPLNTNTATMPVDLFDTTISLGSTPAPPWNTSQAITLDATVTSNPPGNPTAIGGTAIFKDGATTLCAAAGVSSGVAHCAIAALAAGPHSFTAQYNGDGSFDPSAVSNTISQTPTLSNTTTTITSSSLNPSRVTQPVTFTATVASTGGYTGPRTGDLTFKDNGNLITCTGGNQTLSGNTATCQTSTLDAANSPHSITAFYPGDSNFNGSDNTAAPFTQTVNRSDTTTTLNPSSPNPSTPGQNVTFTATVTSTPVTPPTGTVDFLEGATVICNDVPKAAGVWTCATTSLVTEGPHNITAVYNQDATFEASPASNTVVQQVSKTATTTTVVSSQNPAPPGTQVTYTATVSAVGGPLSGSVSFEDAAVPISCEIGSVAFNGTTATCLVTYPTIAGSPHPITAIYSGDGTFATSTGTLTPQQVITSCSASVVVTNANDTGNGSLRDAIATAVCDGGTITFDPLAFAPAGGPYTITMGLGEMAILNSMTIVGPGANVLIVDANNASRVFNISSGKTATISGMTITNGRAPDGTNPVGGTGIAGTPGAAGSDGAPSPADPDQPGNPGAIGVTGNPGGTGLTGDPGGNGGGILNNGTLNLIGMVVKNSHAGNGRQGGMGGTGGKGGTGGTGGQGGPVTTGSNTNGGKGGQGGTGGVGGQGGQGGPGGSGGGIYNAGTLTLTNVTVNGNQTGVGGAAGTVGTGGLAGTVGTGGAPGTGGTVGTGNQGADGDPGLPGASGAPGTVGLGGNGGGIAGSATSVLTLSNSTISGNTAHTDGGGIYHNSSATATLTSVTVSNNTADNDNIGGGVGGGINVVSLSVLILKDTIVSGNFKGTVAPPADDIFGAVDGSSSFNLIGDGAGMTGITNADANSNQVGVDPLLVLGPLGNNGGPTPTHALVANSPAIDTGKNFAITTLSADITTTTSPENIDVADASGIPAGAGYTIRIDSEQMVVTSKSGNTLTVTRPASASTHTTGASVYPAFDQRGFVRTVDFNLTAPVAPFDDTDIGAFEKQIPSPTISKGFGPATIQSGGTSTVTLTLTNPNAFALTGASFTDTLTNISAVGGAAGGTCAGANTNTLGAGATGLLSFSGITIPDSGTNGGICTVTFAVTSSTLGVRPNSTSGVTTTQTPTPGAASNTANLTVLAGPTIAKAFGPATIQSGGTSTVTLTLTNPNATPLTSASFTDTLSGMSINAAGAAGGTCTGASSNNLTAGQTALNFSGITIPANNVTCTVTFVVTSSTGGTNPNATSGVTTAETSPSVGAVSNTANLIVLVAPAIAKGFSPGTIQTGGTSTVTLTLTNPNATPLTNASFTDTLANMSVNATGSASGTCVGANSNNLTAGQTALSFGGITIPANSVPCTVTFVVTSSTLGVNPNSTTGVTTTETATAGLVSNTADLTVVAPPTIAKAFGPDKIQTGGTSTVTLTLTNPNATPLTGASFTDTLSNMSVNATGAAGGTCTGANSNNLTAGQTALSFSGITIPDSGTNGGICTVTFAVTSSTVGTNPNSTSGVATTQTPIAGSGSGVANLSVFAPPTVVSITRADPNPTNLNAVHFTVTFSKPVTGVDTSDFTITTTGGITPPLNPITGVTPAGPSATYTVTVDTGSGDGTLRLNVIDDDSIQSTDALVLPLGGAGAGNGNFTSGDVYLVNKSNAFVSSIVRAGANPTNAANVDFTVTFSTAVTGVDATDFFVTAADITGSPAVVPPVIGSGTTYTVTVSTGTGTPNTIRLDLRDNDSIKDGANAPLGGVGTYTPGGGPGDASFDTGQSYAIDKTAPTVTATIPVSQANPAIGPSATTTINFTVTFSETVTSFTSSAVQITGTATSGSTIASVSGSGTTYNVAVSGMTPPPSGTGTVAITVPAGAAPDPAGNPNNVANSPPVTFTKDDFSTLEVNSLNDSDDGQCTATANGCTLREAISAANVDFGADTITFAPALTSGGPATVTLLTALPDITTDMTIQGPGSGSTANLLTVQRSNAAGRFRIFNTNSAAVTISRLIISSGLTADGANNVGGTGAAGVAGGGILNSGTLNLTNVTVSGNQTGAGGNGMFGGPGGPGGGISNTGTLTITGSTINNNQTGHGGDGNAPPPPNGAGGAGAGIFNTGTLRINNSTISGNQAGAGGVNGSSGNGGGIYTDIGTVTLINATITLNSTGATGTGGGISRIAGTVIAQNTIVAGNLRGNPTLQVETATVVGTITSSGTKTATVTVTAAGMGNSPKTLNVNVVNGDTASDVAGKMRTALGLDSDINTFFTVSGSGAQIVLTTQAAAVNDTSMNIATANGTSTGLTNSPTSADTTPGAAADDINGTVDASSRFNLIGDAASSGGLTNGGVNQNIVGNAGVGVIPINNILDTTLADNGGPTRTHALRCTSPAIDKGTVVLTTLNEASGIDGVQTSFNVTSASFIQVGSVIVIDTEQILVTGKVANALTVTRGVNSTTGATHANGTSINALNPTDQRGGVRPFDLADSVYPNAATPGDGSDIGAYEQQSGGGCLPLAFSVPAAPSTNEDTQVTITLKGTYSQNFPLTFTITQQPGHATANLVPTGTTCSFSTFTACEATVSYTPTANFNGLDSFKFKASAGGLDSDEADVDITVNPINDAPVANPQLVTTDEDTPVAIILTGSDIDSASLSFIIVTPPAHGSLNPGGTGQNQTYTPALNYNGPDSFTFKINDGSLDSNTASVSLTINAINDAPVVDNTGNMTLSAIDEDLAPASNSGTLIPAVIASAGGDRITDVDAGAVEGIAVIAVDNTNGTWEFSIDNGTNWTPFGSPSSLNARLLAANATTRVRFLPNADFNGTVNPGLTFRAWDQTSGANGGTADTSIVGADTAFSVASETASITVNPVNDAPTANAQSTSTNEDTPLPITLTGSDLETAGGNLTFNVTVQPAHGTVSGGTGPNRTYTPAANYNGPDSFKFTVTDTGDGSSAALTSTEATVSITVNAVNDVPSFTKGADQTVNGAVAQTVSGWATDISAGPADEAGQTLTFLVSNNNNAIFSVQPSISPSGTLTYSPAYGFDGVATVTVQLKDNGGTLLGGVDTSAAQTFTITVHALNRVPTLDALANVNINEDASLQTVNLAGITSGPAFESSQSLTVTATSNNTGLIPNPSVTYTSPNTTGSISFTPVPNVNGSAIITVTVKDNGGTLNGGVDTFVRTFTVAVGAVNDAPVNHVPGPQTIPLNTPFVFSTGTGNAIFVTDIDAGSDPVQVTLKATDGTITLNGTAGLSFSAGDGTDDQTMTFTGSLTSINAALEGMKNLAFGSGVIEITTNDLGRNGIGGALTDIDTIAVTVNDNLPPSLLTIEGSDRAIALDSVTLVRDPFALLGLHNFSSDHRTRITLFVLHAQLKPGENASAVTAEADDAGTIIPLTVESVRTVPGFDWLTQIVVKFPTNFATGGGGPQDVKVRITLRGANSNQAVITIVPAPPGQ